MSREIELPSGESVPALGLGTRGLAEGRRSAEEEAAALRYGLDLGIRLVDTAPAYAGGEAEALVGRALAGRRDDAFLLSKVEAERATRPRILAACETSLARLDTDRLDLYVLQGRGDRPLEEIVEAFEGLRERGLIRHWAVGDFSLADLVELAEFDGADVQAVQAVYSLARRDIEWTVLPACLQAGLPLLCSAPLDGGRIIGDGVLRGIAARHRGATSAQVALAWMLNHVGVHAHPRASTPAHVERNLAALDLTLGPDDLLELDNAFEAPPKPVTS